MDNCLWASPWWILQCNWSYLQNHWSLFVEIYTIMYVVIIITSHWIHPSFSQQLMPTSREDIVNSTVSLWDKKLLTWCGWWSFASWQKVSCYKKPKQCFIHTDIICCELPKLDWVKLELIVIKVSLLTFLISHRLATQITVCYPFTHWLQIGTTAG